MFQRRTQVTPFTIHFQMNLMRAKYNFWQYGCPMSSMNHFLFNFCYAVWLYLMVFLHKYLFHCNILFVNKQTTNIYQYNWNSWPSESNHSILYFILKCNPWRIPSVMIIRYNSNSSNAHVHLKWLKYLGSTNILKIN
jgi:hypothetical protein